MELACTKKLLPKLPELILEGIRTLLRSEYVRPEIIEKYLTVSWPSAMRPWRTAAGRMASAR